MGAPMFWERSHRADATVLPLADAHYNRQKPGTPQFVAPGSCIVLATPGRSAFWVSRLSLFAKHNWPGAWECTAYRRERREDGAFREYPESKSSALIVEACAITREKWGRVPVLGMITFVDPDETRRKRDPGRCFRKAGFIPATPRTTKGGLVALQLLPDAFPEPCPPLGYFDFRVSA